MQRILYITFALTLLVLMAGCGQKREEMPAEAKALAPHSDEVKVTVQPVTLRNVQRMVGVVGTLHGYEEISLAAKVEGRVRRIAHDMSDRVQPGEVLLEIDPTDYQIKFRQAQRALQVELAKLGLSEPPAPGADVTSFPTVVQARLRRDNTEKRLERIKNLVAKKAASEEELTEKTSEFRVAQAEYDNQVLIAKAGIAAIQVKLEEMAVAKQQLLDTQLRVPQPSQKLSGTEQGVAYAVSARAVSEGSYVMPGNEVFKIVIENPLKFRGRVPERKIGEVRVGQKAAVYTSAYAQPFPGEVTRISPAIDTQTRTFAVEIVVPNDRAELKPGGFAKTAILTEVDPQAPTVPLEAPIQVAGVTKLFLVEDGKAREVQVTLGVQGDHWVEIAAPKLPEGAQVVTSGQSAIAEGTAVAVRSASPAAGNETPAEQTAAQPSEAPAGETPSEKTAGEESSPTSEGAAAPAAGPVAHRESTP